MDADQLMADAAAELAGAVGADGGIELEGLTRLYLATYRVENRGGKSDFGTLSVEAEGTAEAVGVAYLQLLADYPPRDGWDPPLIKEAYGPILQLPRSMVNLQVVDDGDGEEEDGGPRDDAPAGPFVPFRGFGPV